MVDGGFYKNYWCSCIGLWLQYYISMLWSIYTSAFETQNLTLIMVLLLLLLFSVYICQWLKITERQMQWRKRKQKKRKLMIELIIQSKFLLWLWLLLRVSGYFCVAIVLSHWRRRQGLHIGMGGTSLHLKLHGQGLSWFLLYYQSTVNHIPTGPWQARLVLYLGTAGRNLTETCFF